MDRRERGGQAVTSLLAAFDGLQSQLWTALPGIIQGFDATKQTARVLPALTVNVQQQDGSFVETTMPELLDCPVHFTAGGGVTLTFPVRVGDECLVVFASRCIDNWWSMGSPGNNTAQSQAEFRMHDLSDGFCIAGFSSKPKVIADISTEKAQLRTDDGSTFVEVDPAGATSVVASALVTVVAPTINLVGAVNIFGSLDVTGHVIGEGTNLHTHVHSGVVAGSSNTNPPI